MRLTSIELNNFRCFSSTKITVNESILCVTGNNGSGKSSLLEALYYGCYATSWRTRSSHELVRWDSPHFSIALEGMSAQQEYWSLVSNYDQQKKSIKVNNKIAQSRKEILSWYRVISMSEDDMALVASSPDNRRSFLTKALLLHEPGIEMLLKEYRAILAHRNALLANHSSAAEHDEVWRNALWQKSGIIIAARQKLLSMLQEQMNKLLSACGAHPVELVYKTRGYSYDDDYSRFCSQNSSLFRHERIAQRSLFGAHLDDFEIIYHGYSARSYASRGQQKLLVIIAHLALYYLLDCPALMLIDDIITDFDHERLGQVLELLIESAAPLVITAPVDTVSPFLKSKPYQRVRLG